jgi:hypothetical protein
MKAMRSRATILRKTILFDMASGGKDAGAFRLMAIFVNFGWAGKKTGGIVSRT